MTVAVHETRETSIRSGPNLLAEIHLEVQDLDATRRFYEEIFDSSGAWQEGRRSLVYTSGSQSVAFHQRARPRTLRGSGQHQAYRVPADRLTAVAQAAASLGASVDWWREDRPDEREVTAYIEDPSGNRVQLVPREATRDAAWIDHVAIEVHDLEEAEQFYVSVLGGSPDYWHGWRMDDYVEAFAWGRGEDPCAPWTRRFDVQYWDKLRIARPNMQLFIRFGASVVGLILAGEHRQEPPPDIQKGTPRIVLQTTESAEDVRPRLHAPRLSPQIEDDHVFLRDYSGNYVELQTGR